MAQYGQDYPDAPKQTPPTLEFHVGHINESSQRMQRAFSEIRSQIYALGFAMPEPATAQAVGAAPGPGNEPSAINVIAQQARTLEQLASDFDWVANRLSDQWRRGNGVH